MSESSLPSNEEIAKLPRAAQVAFASRCALRVYPLIGDQKTFFAWGSHSGPYADAILAACFIPVIRGSETYGRVLDILNPALNVASGAAAGVTKAAFFFVSGAVLGSISSAARAVTLTSLTPFTYSAVSNDFSVITEFSFSEQPLIAWEYFQRPLFEGQIVEVERIVTSDIRKAFESIGKADNLALWERFFYGEPPPKEEIVAWIERWYEEHQDSQKQGLELPQRTKAQLKRKATSHLPESEPFAEAPDFPVDAKKEEKTSEPESETTDEIAPEEAEPEPLEAAEEPELPPIEPTGTVTCAAERPALEDSLDRGTLIESLANMLAMPSQEMPLTLGLFGHWGAGKSSVMSLLQKELSGEGAERIYPDFEFLFSWFNAWEYEHTENIQAGLAQEVVNGLLGDGKFDPDAPTLTGQLGWWATKRLQLNYIWKASRKEFLFLLGKIAFTLGGVISGVLYFKDQEVAMAGVLGVGLFFGRELVKQGKMLWDHPLATELATFFKLPSYREELGQIPAIRSQLETLCQTRLRKKGEKRKRLVVFVDDLDRCQTETIAKTFDAIRLIAHIQDVVVIIGIDERIAFKAMGEAYANYADEPEKEDDPSKSQTRRSREDVARDYLGKIIQVPIRLEAPSPKGLHSYIRKTLFPSESRKQPQATGSDLEKPIPVETDGDSDPVPPPEPSFLQIVTDAPRRVYEARREAEAKRVKDREESIAKKKQASSELQRELMQDSEDEVEAFVALSELFQFNNPRQLLRLRNTYRLLKALYPKKREPGTASDDPTAYPEGEYCLMMMLLWLEFRTQNSPEAVRKWEETHSEPETEALESVAGIFQTDFLPQVDFEGNAFALKDPKWKKLEKFTETCLLPFPTKEAARREEMAKVAKE